MESGESDGRGAQVAGWALLAVYAVLLFPFAVARAPGWLPDAYAYLLIAEALSPWGGPASPAALHVLGTSAFPPLYPLLLGLTGPSDAGLARAFGVSCLLAALALLVIVLRGRRWSLARALALACVFALLPITLLQSLEGMSEPLYLVLSLVALGAGARAGEGEGGTEPIAAAALAAGLALTTRTAGLALVAAFCVWLFARRIPRRGAWVALAIAPYALWWLTTTLWIESSGSYPGVLRTRLAFYGADLVPAVAKAVADQLRALFSAWHAAFAFWPGVPTRVAATLIGALALVGLARQLLRLDLTALYVASYLGLIALWPFPAQAGRFLWPVLPLLLALAVEAAVELARGASRRLGGLAAYALLSLALGLALPSLAETAERFGAALASKNADFARTPRWYLVPDLGAAELDARSRRYLAEAMSDVALHVPEKECVYSVVPSEVMWWSRRVSLLPPPAMVDDATFAEQIRDCDWFMLSPLVWPPFRTPYNPRERLGESVELEARLPDGADEQVPDYLGRRRPPAGD